MSMAIDFLRTLEELNRWQPKYIVLDCPTDMAKEIVVSHVRDISLGRRTYHYLLSGLVSTIALHSIFHMVRVALKSCEFFVLCVCLFNRTFRELFLAWNFILVVCVFFFLFFISVDQSRKAGSRVGEGRSGFIDESKYIFQYARFSLVQLILFQFIINSS